MQTEAIQVEQLVTVVTVPIHVPLISANKLADLWTPAVGELWTPTVNESRADRLATMRVMILNRARNGVLPSFHLGKRLVINLAQLATFTSPGQTLKIELSLIVPTMPIPVFADHTGFDTGVVEGWVKKGYLPSIGLGRTRMIPVAEVLHRCLSWRGDQWVALVDRDSINSAELRHFVTA